MHELKISLNSKKSVLALGAESAGNFSIYNKGVIFLSEDFGDLLNEKNFQKFKKSVLDFLKKNKIKPMIIITDLHPLYKTTVWGRELAKKFNAKHIQAQHHLAHIFSAIGGSMLVKNKKPPFFHPGHKGKACLPARQGLQNGIFYFLPNLIIRLPSQFCGIACDGTGYGLDEKIWGGEVFVIKDKKIERVGQLENQIMIGGDLAIKEPARMLISILSKFWDKKEVYKYIKKFYSQNEFEVLYNQFQQKFNCQETSSTGRILDAVSVLLGFAKNERNYKHEPIDLLEKASTEAKPYNDLKPKIKNSILLTTPLFEYLVKNNPPTGGKDKSRLAVTAQLYIAKGLYEIINRGKRSFLEEERSDGKGATLRSDCYFAGGIANNKIISQYLESKGVITNKKIPRGDAGLSFGQIIYCLTNSRN